MTYAISGVPTMCVYVRLCVHVHAYCVYAFANLQQLTSGAGEIARVRAIAAASLACRELKNLLCLSMNSSQSRSVFLLALPTR